MSFHIRQLEPRDVPGAVKLQRECFPHPFPEDQLWQSAHLLRHIEVFPEGQWIAEAEGQVVASCSNCVISEAAWLAHRSWTDTVGGPFIEDHEPLGTTLYGLDISIHPLWRRRGIMRALYERRFQLVRESNGLSRYGTAVRIPGLSEYLMQNRGASPEDYVRAVALGEAEDRTLTPMLRVGLQVRGVIRNYMEDQESQNAAALLEWRPE